MAAKCVPSQLLTKATGSVTISMTEFDQFLAETFEVLHE